MSDLPEFEIGEKLQGFPGRRMKQLVAAVSEALQESGDWREAWISRTQTLLSPHQQTVKVISHHAGALEPFSVLGFDGLPDGVADLDEAVDRSRAMLLEGGTPAASHGQRMLVLQDGAEQGDVVEACFGGLTLARVNVTDADHTHAGLAAGDATRLASGSAGAEIWWRETASTGEQWCLVVLGGGGAGDAEGGAADHSHHHCVVCTPLTAAAYASGAEKVVPGEGKAVLCGEWDGEGYPLSYQNGGAATLVGSDSDTGETNALTLTLPDNLEEGDLAVLFAWGWDDSSGTYVDDIDTVAGDWVRLREEGGGTDQPWVEVWIAEVDEGDSLNNLGVDFALTEKNGAAVAVYRGVRKTGGVAGFTNSNTSPQTTAEFDNALVVRCAVRTEVDGDFSDTGAGDTLFDLDDELSGLQATDFYATTKTQATAGLTGAESWAHDDGIIRGLVTFTLEAENRIDIQNPSHAALDLAEGRGLMGRLTLKDGVYVLESRDCAGDSFSFDG
ncbi:hypothetical protein KOR34_02030 [Posidoniimonas corsicana]|uniref:Uncharacterized protein n=1 Tax=Posidoniimonas corsicana TaxID=1938618 RepID=A0A5C5VBE9_9BACT|nr:hypothetical protein [Posidoniimonas corsicana]TWT35313.1 hypothetical protein KOR34_02030 [Posidoniimonas corsicana]